MVREMKHTEIGDIPVDWKLQTFEETFRVLSNNTLSRADLNNRGGLVRNVHYGDILTRFTEVLNCKKDDIPYINDISLLSLSTQLLQDGDIIIADTAEDDTVGKVTEVYGLGDSRMVAGLHTIPCRVKKGDFASGWLGYYMNSHAYHDQIIPLITGIKVSSVSKSAIAETLIAIPPRNEQAAIVETLFEFDNLIVDIKRTIEKLYDFKQAQLQAMFPKNGRTEPEVRLPGFTDVWKQCKVYEITKFHKQGYYTTENYDDNKKYYLLRGTDLTENKLILKDTPKINATEKDYQSFKTEIGDFLVVRSGTVGTYGIVDVDISAIFGSYLIDFRFDMEQVTNEFFGYFYESDSFKKQLRQIVQQSANTNINAENIKSTSITLPSIAEQKKISEYLGQIDNLITLHQCKLKKYENIKQGVMSELLTGKLRLV